MSKRWRKVKHKKNDTINEKEEKKCVHIIVRAKAFVTDMFMIMMPISYITTYFILNGKDEFQHSQLARWGVSIAYGLIVAYLWQKNGQTPGKKAYDLKVVDSKTFKLLDFKRAIFRYIMFLISATSIIGLLLPFFRKDNKTLHDLLSNSCVIEEE